MSAPTIAPDRRPLATRSRRALFALALFASTLIVVAAVTVALHSGVRLHVADSHGMAPTIGPGDAVLTTPVPAGTLAAGDLVVFRHPDTPARLLVRRVTTTQHVGAVVAISSQDEAGRSMLRWAVDADGSVGAVRARVPGAGRLVAAASSTTGRALALAIPMIGLIALAVLPRRRDTRGEVLS